MKNTINNLIKAMSEKEVDIVPKGWFTKEEIMIALKRSRTTTRDKIEVMIKNGTLIQKKFRVLNKQNVVRPKSFFRTKL